MIASMTSLRRSLMVLLLILSAPLAVDGVGQTSPSKSAQPASTDRPKDDFSKEAVVVEVTATTIEFRTDGTAKRQQKTRIRIQSEAGVQQYGVLSFAYESFVEHLDIDYVRVQKPDGTVVATPPDSVQDMPTEVSRSAPFYSDLREKQVAVKRLSVGDVLEYAATWQQDKPLAPGNFWFGWQFTKNTVVLDEQLEVTVPRDREVKVKSQELQPVTHEEQDRRIFTWKASHLESVSKTAEKQGQQYETARGLLPPPDVLISSFRNWEEVGRWYNGLQIDAVKPSPEIKVKATELTKGLTDTDAKLKALYDYVSLRYRYIGIAFGIGRYQPHSAADILDNQYGDCKDKHTLLASLLSAAGIQAYPALINTSRSVDQDVPSPGQFDHVITVVPKGGELTWMDTTAEVAPLGLLMAPLRDKPALVIKPERSEFLTTPASGPVQNLGTFRLSGKLSAEGILEADAQYELRGDEEVVVRLAFRRVSQAQWKDLVQSISYGTGFAGTVSDIEARAPEKTDTAFKFTYHYSRKDYADWSNHRILACLPPIEIPAVSEEDINRQKPLWLGYPAEWEYESRIELPKGFSAQLPQPVKLKEEYAEYEDSTTMEGDVMVTKRRLRVKNREVIPSQLKSYEAFQKAASDDEYTYIPLTTAGDLASTAPFPFPVAPLGSESWLKAMTQLPISLNAEAMDAESDARRSMSTRDINSAIVNLQRAVADDPKFARAWIELGIMHVVKRDKAPALDAFEKAVDADQQQVITRKVLAKAYVHFGEPEKAVKEWEEIRAIAPQDAEIVQNLGSLYIANKQYKDAIGFYESAAKAKPLDSSGQFNLGTALLRSGEKERGLAALHKALDLDSNSEMLNGIAYEMAEDETDLTEALGYSQRSIKDIEEKSQKTDLNNVSPEDLRLPFAFAAYWDTLGWIYYKMGNVPIAEKCLKAAWQLGAYPVVGDHLGQVYEKEKKLADAVRMYNLALEVNPKMEETSARLRKLAHVTLPSNRTSAGEELSRMRTVKLARIVKGTASADFYVLLAPGGKLKNSSFIHGSELLRFADNDLAKASFNVEFPPDSSAYVLRKGILSCSSYTGCTFVFYPLNVAAAGN